MENIYFSDNEKEKTVEQKLEKIQTLIAELEGKKSLTEDEEKYLSLYKETEKTILDFIKIGNVIDFTKDEVRKVA